MSEVSLKLVKQSQRDYVPDIILTDTSAGKLRNNPMATACAGHGFRVVILNRNQPASYCVPAKLYEKTIDIKNNQ